MNLVSGGFVINGAFPHLVYTVMQFNKKVNGQEKWMLQLQGRKCISKELISLKFSASYFSSKHLIVYYSMVRCSAVQAMVVKHDIHKLEIVGSFAQFISIFI